MKQLIILILVIILGLIGYSKYSQYKRFNAPEVNYKAKKNIDINYHNKDFLLNYYEAVEDLDGYVMMQWTANNIDVRKPEDDDNETKLAINTYAEKLANVNYYEAILNQSLQLKQKGLSNDAIAFMESKGMDLETYNRKNAYQTIKDLYDPKENLYRGDKTAIIYEVQKRLTELGDSIKIDGIYRIETLNAIKSFEEKNNLLADGYLDILTIEKMFE